MNGHNLHSLRRRIDLSRIYRTILCFVAVIAISLAGALKLSEHFSPLNMESRTIRGQSFLQIPVTLREDEEMEPLWEGSLKNQIYYTEEPDVNNEKKEEKEESFFPITEIDMSSGAARGEVLIRDSDSGLKVDVQRLLYSPYPDVLKSNSFSTVSTSDSPLVLILHTHATESYSEEGSTSYTADTAFRSTDTEKNVVAVGKVMADILNENGIPTLHCTLLHDAENYNASYDNSLETVKKYLKEYPSIKYIFDVHRDAIIRESGEALKPTCIINGKACAQVMTLVGTNAGGAAHSDWEENNMNLAVKLQHNLTTDYNGMARPINLRRLSFHQQYAPGSLLFEIGSCANTLEEAKTAGANLAEAIAKTIRNG